MKRLVAPLPCPAARGLRRTGRRCGDASRQPGKTAEFQNRRRRPRKPTPSSSAAAASTRTTARPTTFPDGLDDIPDAEPKWEPLHKPATGPTSCSARNTSRTPRSSPTRQRGIASWYGKKFHGQKTSIGEPYDMFAMTAAHPTLAICPPTPRHQRADGKSVVVRVTDRGPFHADRVIDLSYTAAYKLGACACICSANSTG
jgi:rare lipoprotein A